MMSRPCHPILKAAFLAALALPVAGSATASTTATAEQYHQAYCIYMRYATVNMKAGDMDSVKQALQGAAQAEQAYLAIDGTPALDASKCPGVDLAATYEPDAQPAPAIDEEIRLAKQQIAIAQRKDTEIKRRKEREAERRAEREAEARRQRERERERELERSASSNTGLNTLLTGLNTLAQVYGAYKQQEYAVEQQQESIRAARVQQQLAYQRQQQQRYRDAQRIQTEQARRAEQERRAQQSWTERKMEDLLTTRTETFQLSARTTWDWGNPTMHTSRAESVRCRLALGHGADHPDLASGHTRPMVTEANRHLKEFSCSSVVVTDCSTKWRKGDRGSTKTWQRRMTTATGYTTCKWKG